MLSFSGLHEKKVLPYVHWEDPNVKAVLSVAPAIAAIVGLFVSAMPGSVEAHGLKVVSDKTVTTFKFPETVAYDPNAKVFYVSEFGSELKPTQMDGKGRISKVSLDGTVLEEQFLPAHGQTMNKPKGMWIKGAHLWVTDIDGVWEFDLKTRKGKKLDLPGAKFANDTALIGDTLYVSDNRGDQLFSVHPAEFLDGNAKATLVWSGKSINPNGIFPAGDGSLLMVGFVGADSPRGIFSMKPGSDPQSLSSPIGMLDGVYRTEDGELLVTDWVSGSLFTWESGEGMHKLADGFKGPADFAVAPNDQGLLVVVPDLVKSELRFIQLSE